MKRLFALLMVLCLLCTVSAGLAEVVQADGGIQAFDGFSLNLDDGVVYIKSEKAKNQVYVQVYPYYAVNGDDTANFNFVWIGTTGTLTVDDVRGMIPSFKTSFKDTYAAAGYTLDSIEFADPYDSSLIGEQCVVLESQQYVLDPQGAPFDVFQRQYYFGSNGFIITVTGRTPAALESVNSVLEKVLAWE